MYWKQGEEQLLYRGKGQRVREKGDKKGLLPACMVPESRADCFPSFVNMITRNHKVGVVCGVDGFRHYRHCLEYSTDTFGDPYEALAGLDRKTMAELIVMAEEAVADMPLETLEWYHEKFILDYFAEVGLFLNHGLYEWAETTLRALIKLRCQSPDIGPDHHETITLYGYLEQALRAQKKNKDADEVAKKIYKNKQQKKTEKVDAERSLWDQWIQDPFESIVDPNKKEREEEEKIKKEVRASKKSWRKIREERFKFLDGAE